MGNAHSDDGPNLLGKNYSPDAEPLNIFGKVAVDPQVEKVIDPSTPFGYRVLGVQSNSPAAYTGLVACFDFIVAANGIPLRTLDTTFIGIIKV